MKSKVQAIYKETVQQLSEIYGEAEARSIADILFADLYQITRTDRLTNPNRFFPAEKLRIHTAAVDQLMQYQPVQQVVGHCQFYGKLFKVNEHTLIPRPETEELVDLIIHENGSGTKSILDIGTGTGCIAISLASNLQGAIVSAWDISADALLVAQENAALHEVTVDFRQQDVFSYQGEDRYDIIVSNPPYIPISEKANMHPNVIRYEPGIALFVEDHDPLIYYRKISELGKTNLRAAGRIYLEIHEHYGAEVCRLLSEQGYDSVRVITDLQGKDRMVRAES